MDRQDRPGRRRPHRLADADPPKADAEACQRYWRDRTNAVHDAAEAFYRDTPPKRKTPKDG